MNRFDRLSKIAQDEFGVTIKLKPSTGETFDSLYGETTDIDGKEKQIEEISKIIDKSPWKVYQDFTGCHINSSEIAEYLYNADYRKQVDVAKKIFDDIERELLSYISDYYGCYHKTFDELKKKYGVSDRGCDK